MTPLPRNSSSKVQSPTRHRRPSSKWLSTKNRSPRHSTPRHPQAIAMASTAKPPNPIPYVTPHQPKRPRIHRGKTPRRPALHTPTHTLPSHGRLSASRTRSTDAAHLRRQAPTLRTHAIAPAPAAHARRTSAPRMQAPSKYTDPRMFARTAPETRFSAYGNRARGTPATRSRSVSGSFRAVAQVAVWGIRLLLRRERVGYGNVPDNAYVQGDQELGASAGACRASSLANSQGPSVACPPHTLVCALPL
jgi:hypothetical protein